MASSKRKTKNISAYEVVEIFKQNPGKVYSFQHIVSKLQLNKKEYAFYKEPLEKLLEKLVAQGNLIKLKEGIFSSPINEDEVLTGTVDMAANGMIYVKIEGLEKDIIVMPEYSKSAIQSDTVKVLITKTRRNNQHEGKITEIVERYKTEFTGVISSYKNKFFFTPDNNKIAYDFLIDPKGLIKPIQGEKVILKITDWNEKGDAPIGRIVKVLGKPGEHKAEIHAILHEYGLSEIFPDEVNKACEKIPDKISHDEIKSRRDFREKITFTIDPQDAKDFDDALSVEKLDNNEFEIGVHIADVSHYVLPGSVIDKEAYRRATSVYLVDRTVPMLPEKLSNNLCSLRPNEDKLCYSAVFKISSDGEIKGEWYGRTVIHSDKRFTYEEAQQIIEEEKGPFVEEILILDGIAKKLRANRIKKGAILFEKKEVKFKLDHIGKPISVFFKEAKDSNKLIEEFMLLANRKVAELIALKPTKNKSIEFPFVYRIHDSPNDEKLNQFKFFVKKLGYKLQTDSRTEISKSLNDLIAESKGKKEENVINQVAIRTMAKAAYSTKNIGHYGLAFDHYTHFTSPIRRYPDVMVHRLLEEYLNTSKISADVKILEAGCKNSSDMEKTATEAERASIKFKQVEYMSDKKDTIFKAIITGVTDYGIFAEIEENLCEGLIRVRDITSDYFELDSDNYCLRGKRSKRVFRLGDEVFVKVKKADIVKKQLDFNLIE